MINYLKHPRATFKITDCGQHSFRDFLIENSFLFMAACGSLAAYLYLVLH